jgi:hypothetical protein
MVVNAKDFLDFMLKRLRAERMAENLWLAFFLTGEYVEFLKDFYQREEKHENF